VFATSLELCLADLGKPAVSVQVDSGLFGSVWICLDLFGSVWKTGNSPLHKGGDSFRNSALMTPSTNVRGFFHRANNSMLLGIVYPDRKIYVNWNADLH